jgi:hypothetical protein
VEVAHRTFEMKSFPSGFQPFDKTPLPGVGTVIAYCSTAMLLMLVWLALLGQGNNGADSSEVQKHPCGFCWGKRITRTSGLLLFCVPHGMKVRRAAGFEGDIRDVILFSHRGETGELIISSSVNPSGFRKPPDWFPAEAGGHSTVRAWRCSEGDGRDLRLDQRGRYWRMITFPLGYAVWRCSSKHCRSI